MKVIQIAVVNEDGGAEYLYALADDGTIWRLPEPFDDSPDAPPWLKVKPVPGEEK